MKAERYILMCLISLLLPSCSNEREDERRDDPVSAVQLAMSVGTSTSVTRMSDAVTQAQAQPVFLGIQDIVLIPFNISTDTVTADASRHDGSPNLILPAAGSIPKATSDNSISTLNPNSNSQIYQLSTPPDGVNAFLFYGKAKTQDGGDFVNGSLTAEGLNGDNVRGIKFSPTPIYNKDDAPVEALAMCEYLSGIINADAWTDEDHSLPLLKSKMIRLPAGCSNNVLGALQLLYNAIKEHDYTNTDGSQHSDAVHSIVDAMKIGTGSDAVLKVNESGILSWNDSYAGSANYPGVKLNNYPACYGLPDGAAAIQWQNDDENKYVPIVNGTFDNVGMTGHDREGTKLNRYAYPAPLYYRANTKVKVSNGAMPLNNDAAADSHKTWTELLNSYSGEQSEELIDPSTTSIALVKPAEYAVGRLDIIVKSAAATLSDKNETPIDVSGLTLTGVLVAGQRPVDFAFNPITDEDTPQYTIYDSNINGTINLTVGSEKVNHTLVLQTPVNDVTVDNVTSQRAEKVYLYLEFLNDTGGDIEANGGVVPPGCKLYLGGIIQPDATHPEYPIFAQDKVTTITATVTSLKDAYNYIMPKGMVRELHLHTAIRDWNDPQLENRPLYNW